MANSRFDLSSCQSNCTPPGCHAGHDGNRNVKKRFRLQATRTRTDRRRILLVIESANNCRTVSTRVLDSSRRSEEMCFLVPPLR
jgi:hypothetical protein